ncbi:tail fiber protein [Photorhabdus bodei]|uniref:tail fiber protein n=1 Tax=Photorhabdus bodei TaxID=2029681 RepID=UPI001EE437AA|nr:tail fiber protein [Photorhabdus bodei]
MTLFSLGLTETVNLAKSAYPKSGGVLDGNVSVTGVISSKGVYEYPSIRVYSSINKPSPGELGAYTKSEVDDRITLSGIDAASFEGNNIEIRSWYGIGLKATIDNQTRIFFNTRNGDIFTKGTIHIGDAIHYYDGNTTGSIWGGDLHSYINNNFSRKNDGIPVGSPIPWPLPNPPSGYLTCNGQSFNKSLYPQLAMAYPSGALPDLRGEFIRGWDDGRGVDSGRGVLSWQPQQVQWHQHLGGHGGRAQGAFGVTNLAGHPGSYRDDAQQTLPFTNNGSDYQGFTNNGAVGAETRPRNIAFNYIVRAA